MTRRNWFIRLFGVVLAWRPLTAHPWRSRLWTRPSIMTGSPILYSPISEVKIEMIIEHVKGLPDQKVDLLDWAVPVTEARHERRHIEYWAGDQPKYYDE